MHFKMATSSTLDSGEPVAERSVDGNNIPIDGESNSGDKNPAPTKALENVVIKDLREPLPTYPNYDYEADNTNAKAEADFVAHHLDLESYEEEDKNFEIMDMSNFPPMKITLRDVFFKIIPSIGAASYEYFSLKITCPSWFLRAFSGKDEIVSNSLWLKSHVGIGLYLYSRKHFRTLPTSRRLLYSTFGSLLFNYGSCLFWALGRNYLPRIPAIHVTFGLLSGGILLYVGQDYLHYLDRTCSDVDISSP